MGVLTLISKEQEYLSMSKKWECIVCGWVYSQDEGWPEDGIEKGTAWKDVPDDWFCPECGVGKEDFEMIEIDE
jgi:rubredoxin